MEYLKQNSNAIILCLLEVLIGVLLLIDPIGFTSGIIIMLGVALLIAGVIFVIGYFSMGAIEAAISRAFAKGLTLILAGAFCIFKSEWFIATFPLLTILYGIVVLIAGMSKVQWTVDALRVKISKWYLPAISAVVSILCAVVILSNPFATTLALWMFIGISLIFEAVLDVVVLIFNARNNTEYGN